MNYGKKDVSKKADKTSSKSTKVKKKYAVLFFKYFLIFLMVVVIIGACAGFGIVKGLIDSAPNISNIDVAPQGLATTVYAADGTETAKLVSKGSNREYINIDEIPLCLQHAFVAIEDERFYDHNGIDIIGILRAAFVGISNGGKFSEGASTITQQLLKNNVFSNWVDEEGFWDSLQRKIQEQYLAVQLEKTMDKDTILEYYLNTINLGQNCLGVQTASKRYFNKDASELTISESAVIAAITQNPSYYNPVSYPDHNAKRREKVLNNMLKHEYISQDEYDEAMADDVYSRISVVNNGFDTSSIYTYFVDELIEQVITALMDEKGYTENQAYNAVYSGGLSIYTTQDMEIQKICDEEMNNSDNYPAKTQYQLSYRLSVQNKDGEVTNYSENDLLKYFQESSAKYDLVYNSEEEAYNDIEKFKAATLSEDDTILENGENATFILEPQASVTVMDQYTGEVKAIVGGRGEKAGSLTLNRATDITRQPGSTFKVLSTFAPALDTAGMTLATVFDDSPFSYSNGRPVNNYYSGYRGLNSIRKAIEQSMNIITVKALTEITPQLGYDYLLNFGFTTLVDSLTLEDGSVASDITQPLALGGITLGVKNVEITAAYAAIANNGVYTKPIFFTKILDAQGNVLIENTPETHTVLKETTSFLLTSAMQDVITQGTGGRANFGTMPIAGKTGTTSDNYDIWLCAYTPYYTCSVWGGYDKNKSLPDTVYHMKIWKNIMSRIHENLEYKEFPVPESITTASVCAKSGKLAVEGLCDMDPRGSMIRTEYFAPGTEPTEVCDCHVSATICKDSGKLVSDYCPADSREQKVFIVRPEGSTGETDDSEYELPSELADSICDIHSSKTQHNTGNVPTDVIKPSDDSNNQQNNTNTNTPANPALPPTVPGNNE